MLMLLVIAWPLLASPARQLLDRRALLPAEIRPWARF
jgi:hypothetical protein